MRLNIEIHLRNPKLHAPALEALASCFAELAHASAQQRHVPFCYDVVSLFFVSSRKIAQIHLQALQVPGDTDVITLPYGPSPEAPQGSAELFINAALAFARGTDRTDLPLTPSESARAWSPAHELALYLAHGFDHLTGNHDSTPEEFLSMRERELEWLDVAESKGLLSSLFKHAPTSPKTPISGGPL